MQVTINVPDTLPLAIVQQHIREFETKLKQLQDAEEFKIDKQACLDALAKIKRGDKSDITEIGNISDYIKNLKNEIS